MVNEGNTAMHFECEIDSLSYATIERAIARYFDMGYPSSSNIPIDMQADIYEICTLVCTKKSGKFSISAYPLKNGKYYLSVSLQGELSSV